LLQEYVTEVVAVRVVDLLEFVEIEEEKPDHLVLPVGRFHGVRQLFLEELAVGQRRQFVVVGEIAGPLFGSQALFHLMGEFAVLALEPLRLIILVSFVDERDREQQDEPRADIDAALNPQAGALKVIGLDGLHDLDPRPIRSDETEHRPDAYDRPDPGRAPRPHQDCEHRREGHPMHEWGSDPSEYRHRRQDHQERGRDHEICSHCRIARVA
jgi:hypothetical protein